MADLAIRIDRIDEDIKEHRTDLDEAHNRLDIQSDAIRGLEYWRNGNGAQGAEARLQCVEEMALALARERIVPRLAVVEADIRAVQAIADNAIRAGVQEAIHTTLNAREKTMLARIKTWTPIVSAALAAAAVVLVAILK